MNTDKPTFTPMYVTLLPAQLSAHEVIVIFNAEEAKANDDSSRKQSWYTPLKITETNQNDQ